MKTKLSLSVLLLVGFVISITVIQSAEAADAREKMGLAALWTFDKATIQGKKLKTLSGRTPELLPASLAKLTGFAVKPSILMVLLI